MTSGSNLTVAVTARDLNPLPYSPVPAVGNRHLIGFEKILSWNEAATYHGYPAQSIPSVKFS